MQFVITILIIVVHCAILNGCYLIKILGAQGILEVHTGRGTRVRWPIDTLNLIRIVLLQLLNFGTARLWSVEHLPGIGTCLHVWISFFAVWKLEIVVARVVRVVL